MAELLLELFSEEIPAACTWARRFDDLEAPRHREAEGRRRLSYGRADAYATPRRLALVMDGLPTAQPYTKEEKEGPLRVGSPHW